MMIDQLLKIIDKAYPLTELEAGEFKKLKVSGMNFAITPYDAKGLGRVCIMDVTGMMGLMKMQTLIVNPFSVDAPLLSYDRMLVMGKDNLYLEPFNTLLGDGFDESEMVRVMNQFAALPDKDPGEHWYDYMRLKASICKSGKKIGDGLNSLAAQYYAAYIAAVQKAPACDEALKRKKAAVYSDGLIENGGPATDPFLKQFGKEKTREFFRKVLFGAGE